MAERIKNIIDSLIATTAILASGENDHGPSLNDPSSQQPCKLKEASVKVLMLARCLRREVISRLY